MNEFENSNEQKIRREINVERRIRSGASWFYWIAGLSAINSAILFFNGSINFVFGLGATQLVDGYAYAYSDYYGILSIVLGFSIDALLAGLFVYLGVMANRCRRWAFIAVMVLYALDSIVFIVFTDFIGIAAHLFALFFIFNAFRALNAADSLLAAEAE